MTAWVGDDGRGIEQSYRDMAQLALRGISPTYELLCPGVADDRAMIDRLARLPPGALEDDEGMDPAGNGEFDFSVERVLDGVEVLIRQARRRR